MADHKTFAALMELPALLLLIANVAAFLSYHVIDKHVMFIPLYIVGSIWVASGIELLIEWFSRRNPRVNTARLCIQINTTLMLIVAIGTAINWPAVSLRQNQRVYQFAEQVLEEVDQQQLSLTDGPPHRSWTIYGLSRADGRM